MDCIVNRLTYKGSGIETIAMIPWTELGSKASIFSPFAYINPDGVDMRSLKLNIDMISCGFHEALSLNFDQQDRYLKLTMDWSKVRLSDNSVTLQVTIEGNHNFSWERSYIIIYEQIAPTATVVGDIPKSVTWGSNHSIISLKFVGGEPGCSDWMFKGNNEVFIFAGDGFYIVEDNVEKSVLDGKPGYKLSIKPSETAFVQFYYNYGTGCINENLQKELILLLNGEKKSYVINFTPMMPTIVCEVIRTTDKYEIGSEKTDIARVSVKKSSGNEADLQNVSVFDNSGLFTFCEVGNNEFIVYVNRKKFKLPLMKTKTTPITVKAINAKKRCEKEIILTPDIATLPNAIQVVAENVLEVYGLPQQPVILYRGNSCKTLLLDIVNKGEIPITNVSVSLFEEEEVKFEDNSYRLNLPTIPTGSKYLIKLLLSADKQKCDQTITLVINADYVGEITRIIHAKSVEKEEAKVDIRLCDKVDGECYVGETYINQKYASVKFTSVVGENVDLESVKTINLSDVRLNDDAGLFKLSIQGPGLLAPGETIEYPLVINGSAEHENVACTIILGEQQEVFNIPFLVKKYYGFGVGVPPGEELEYPILLDRLKVVTIEVGDKIPIDGRFPKEGEKIELSNGFMFEDGSTQLVLMRGGKFDVFLNVREVFGGVANLYKEEKVKLSCTYSSDMPKESESIDNVLVINPYCAKPELGLEFVLYGSDATFPVVSSLTHIGAIQYTLPQAEDLFLEIGDVLFLNRQKIPYREEGIKIHDIKVDCDYGIVVSGSKNPENIFIKNGMEPVPFKILLDWAKWKKNGRPSDIEFSIIWEKDLGTSFSFCLREKCIDDVYSLDLGTTGIVMARLRDFEISLLTLQDANTDQKFNIEQDTQIISSITVLKKHGDAKEYPGVGEIELSPSRKDYYSDKNSVLVPSKFVIGQQYIPYLDLYKSMNFSKITVCSNEGGYSFDEESENYLTPDKYIELIYQDIFDRMGDEDKNVKKLIVTYPNTYTPDKIEVIKTILTNRFVSLMDIQFVPESDAVVAFYFDKRINGLDENLDGFNQEEEKILIYDMGAGTLDLSLVIIRKIEGQIVATIEKKIGIPIAGNFLDYMLFESLKKENCVNLPLSIEDEKNAKKFIMQIKKDFPETPQDCDLVNKETKEYEGITTTFLKDGAEIKYSNLKIDSYLGVCGNLVLTTLLGDMKPDKVVFSGRASQFKPLRKAVKGTLGDKVIIHELDTDGSCLKTCVALGAIKYTELFANEQDYRIENRNHYLKLGMVYFAPADDGCKNEVKYAELINPDDEKWDDEAECINGTWCRVFHTDCQVNLKLRNKLVYFIQTLLSEEDIIDLYKTQYTAPVGRRDDLKWSFVNELFYINSSEITCHDLDHVNIEIGIDKENRMTRRIGARNMSDKKVVENIENNIFYKWGMWPFEQKNKNNGRN